MQSLIKLCLLGSFGLIISTLATLCSKKRGFSLQSQCIDFGVKDELALSNCKKINVWGARKQKAWKVTEGLQGKEEDQEPEKRQTRNWQENMEG